MKRLKKKLKTILANKSGESLMECVASLLILSVLLMAVTMMLRTSLQITKDSTVSANSVQTQANAAILEEYTGTGEPLKLVDSENGIEVSIGIKFYSDDTFTAFTPEEAP